MKEKKEQIPMECFHNAVFLLQARKADPLYDEE